jgi:hypothetical protein
MSARSFELAFDACLEAISSGRQALEECLAEWPEYADELRPLLLTIATVAAAREPLPMEPDASEVARFTAQLRPRDPRPSRVERWRRFLPGPRLPALRPFVVAAPAAVALAIAVVLLLLPGPASPHSATLTVFAGGVERLRDGDWTAVPDGGSVEQGDHIRVAEGGQALLTFPDGSAVTVGGGSELVVERARGGEAREVILVQLSGRLWNDVVPDARSSSTYRVRTGNAVVEVHGTVFETAVEGGETAVSTAHGLVEVRAGQVTTLVPAGSRARARSSEGGVTLEPGMPVGAPLAELVVRGPFVASLLAPSGAATGVRPDGLVYHQIPGAVSSNPADGPQRIAVHSLHPGEYVLLLRRYAPGGAEVLVSGEATPAYRTALVAGHDLARIPLQVSEDQGALVVTPLAAEALLPGELALAERIVLTEELRRRADRLAEELARRAAEEDDLEEDDELDDEEDEDDERGEDDEDGDGDNEAEDHEDDEDDDRDDEAEDDEDELDENGDEDAEDDEGDEDGEEGEEDADAEDDRVDAGALNEGGEGDEPDEDPEDEDSEEGEDLEDDDAPGAQDAGTGGDDGDHDAQEEPGGGDDDHVQEGDQ